MKYVVTWKPRPGGSAADNEASAARFDDLAKHFTPSKDTTIHQSVVRVDGDGGFAIIESEDVAAVARTVFKFAPLKEYSVIPVLDYEEGLRVAGEAEVFRASVKKR